MTLLVIWKSLKPTCFKKVKLLSLERLCPQRPKHGWPRIFFTEWLKKIDKTQKGQNCKFLLSMDQCTVHPKQADFLENANIFFFSEKCIGQLHLLDLSIIKKLKVHYRKQPILLTLQKSTRNAHRNLNILQAMNMIAYAWIN